MENMRCVLCDSETILEKMCEEKEKMLKKADKSLKGRAMKKARCDTCGHTAYILEN